MTGQKNNNDKKDVCEMWERILRGMRMQWRWRKEPEQVE